MKNCSLLILLAAAVALAQSEGIPHESAQDLMDRLDELEMWREDKQGEDDTMKDSLQRLDLQLQLLSKDQEKSSRALRQMEERIKWLEDSTRSIPDMTPQDQEIQNDFNRRMKDPRFRLQSDAAQDRRVRELEGKIDRIEEDLQDIRTSLSTQVKNGLNDIDDLTDEADGISEKLTKIQELIESGGTGGTGIWTGGKGKGKGKGRGKKTADGWTLEGCYEETSSRVLNYQIRQNDPTMTGERCRKLCSDNGNGVAGLKNGNECFCGEPSELLCATRGRRDSCDERCAGDSQETCGGLRHLSVFKKDNYKESGWVDVGCFRSRVVPIMGIRRSRTMSPQTCNAECKKKGYNTAGTSRGRYCYCGKAENLTCDTRSEGRCTTTCRGDRKNVCGGYGVASVFQYFS